MWGNTRLVSQAIHEKRELSFTYNGYHRLVLPYALGIDTKGHSVLKAYQIGGVSQSGALPGWRSFKIDRLEQLTLLEQTFDQIAAELPSLNDLEQLTAKIEL